MNIIKRLPLAASLFMLLPLTGCLSVADAVGYDTATLNNAAAKSYTEVVQQAQQLDDGCIWLHALWLLCSKHPNSVVLANLRKHMDQDPSPTPPPPSARDATSPAVTRNTFGLPRSHTAPDSAHRHRSQKTGESPPRYGYTPRWGHPDARALAGCSLAVQGR